MTTKVESQTRRGIKKMREANIDRQVASQHSKIGDASGATSYQMSSNYLEQQAAELLTSEERPLISCGEVKPADKTSKSLFINNTLDSPDSAAIDASIARTDLLLQDGMDITALAIDAAHSIDAENSLEKMLAHQMAATHKVTMEMMDKASQLSQGLTNQINLKSQETVNVQATRLINSTCRLMKTYQQGLLTIQKIRNGGNQTVTVQHVNVNDGGQAVIGNVGGATDPTGGDMKKDVTP